MQRLVLVIILCVSYGLAITSCASAPAGIVTTSEYLKTEQAGLIQSNGYPRYSLRFKVLKAIPQYAFFRVSYENPVDESKPFVVKAWPKQGELILLSRSLDAIRDKTTYLVKIELLENRQVLSEHRQYVRYELSEKDRETIQADLLYN